MSVSKARERTSYEMTGWDLSELLAEPSEQLITQRLEELEEAVREFEARREELSPAMDPATLVELLRHYEVLVEKMQALSAYGSLWFASDTQSEEALTFRNRIQQALTGFSNRILFFSLWWKGLEEEEAEALLPPETEADFRHYLEDARRANPVGPAYIRELVRGWIAGHAGPRQPHMEAVAGGLRGTAP